MTSTHVHLLLNHFPIVGILIGTILLITAYATKNEIIRKVSLATIFGMAILAIPVFFTGEPAEETVEKLPGVLESIIKEHEEAAEIAFWVMMATGAAAFMSYIFLMLQHKIAKTSVALVLLLSITTSVLMVRAGYLGGQIRHTEIQANTVAGQAIEKGGEQEDED